MIRNIYVRQIEGNDIYQKLNAIIELGGDSQIDSILDLLTARKDEIQAFTPLTEMVSRTVLAGQEYRFVEYVPRKPEYKDFVLRLESPNVWSLINYADLSKSGNSQLFSKGMAIINNKLKKMKANNYMSAKYVGTTQNGLLDRVDKCKNADLLAAIPIMVAEGILNISVGKDFPAGILNFDQVIDHYRMGFKFMIKQAGSVPTEIMINNMLTEIEYRRKREEELVGLTKRLEADLEQAKDVIQALLRKEKSHVVEECSEAVE